MGKSDQRERDPKKKKCQILGRFNFGWCRFFFLVFFWFFFWGGRKKERKDDDGLGAAVWSVETGSFKSFRHHRSPDIIAACVFVAGEKAAGGHFNYRKRAAKPDEEIHHRKVQS